MTELIAFAPRHLPRIFAALACALLTLAALPATGTAAPVVGSPSAGATLTGVVGVLPRPAGVAGSSRVELLVDGTVAGSAIAPPWGILWDTRVSRDGAHRVQVVAVAPDGRRTTSAPVSVTVRNGAGGGLEATYFHDEGMSDPAHTRIDTGVDFDWGRGRPVPGMPADGFAVRWAGTVEAPTTDSYVIAVTARDGVRMWVDNRLVVDRWSSRELRQHTARLSLVARRRYALRIEYRAHEGDASIRLRWKSFHSAMTAIPQRLLRPTLGESASSWGLRARVFGGRMPRASSQLASRVDSSFDFDWGHGGLDRDLPRDDFLVRWEGSVRVPRPGVYRFWATADDGVRLRVGSRTVLADWRVHAPRTSTGRMTMRRGVRYAMRVDYFEQGGGARLKLEWQPPGGKRGPIPAHLLRPTPAPPKPPAPTSGLIGTYYDDVQMTQQVHQRLDPQVRFDWGSGRAPDPELYPDTFSARWTGSIVPPVSGEYRISTYADDGVRLFVDGELVIDEWRVRSARRDEARVLLEAGRAHDVELQYFQGTGRAKAELAWTPPGGSRATIPTEHLLPRAPDPVPKIQRTPPPPPVPEPGLWGVYHDNEDFTGRMWGRVDPQLAMRWKRGRPHPSVGQDTFSATWTGTLAVPIAGSWRLATEADDGVRVWLDGQLVIDRWTWRSPPLDRSAVLPLVPGRRYDLRVEHHDGGGDSTMELRWSSERVPEQPIPAWAFMTPGPTSVDPPLPPAPAEFAVTDEQLSQPGLLGLYWDDRDYLRPVAARIDETIDSTWKYGSPLSGMGRDSFAIRWLGSVEAPASGDWQFHVTMDDGARLWVCGQLVLESWKDQRVAEHSSQPIRLEPGTRCAIRLDYYEKSGASAVKLAWSASGQPKQLIPVTALRPPARSELGPLWWW